jgi:hypothetical protein
MNMNMRAAREKGDPEVVLYQCDAANAMNPHGLLVAYKEESVRPVVSDFDTFTVGSSGVMYDTLPEDQQDLAMWSLRTTRCILENEGSISWNSRWLDVLGDPSRNGPYTTLPKYGYGDAKSYSLIQAVAEATHQTGAVRHGAECFNFYFPQELDDEYLVVWEDYEEEHGKPWNYLDEESLRDFLEDSIGLGYSFPLNPVWTIRDLDWYDILQAQRESDDAGIQANLKAWYPPASGILEFTQKCHEDFPDGFGFTPAEHNHVQPPHSTSEIVRQDQYCNSCDKRQVRISTFPDLSNSERADLASALITRKTE